MVAESDADANLDRALIRLLTERGDDKTVCPSEVARAVDGEHWRDLMEPARATARRAVARGDAEITQHPGNGLAGMIAEQQQRRPALGIVNGKRRRIARNEKLVGQLLHRAPIVRRLHK